MTDSRLTGVQVMIIDDSKTIRYSAALFLRQAGCTVIQAENGFDALSKVTTTKPDVIFADIAMPRLDGYQACALIKHSKHGTIPIVMLSSKGSSFDRARGRMAGASEHLTKPFTKDGLIKAVEAQLARRYPTRLPQAA